MDFTVVLSIVGGFGTLALGVNAFFLRGIYQDLNDVRINVASIITDDKSKEKRIDALEKEADKMREKFHAMNTELHQLKSVALLKNMEEN